MIRSVPAALAIAFAFASPPACAQRISRLSGAQLLSICSGERMKEVCEGYINGVADGMVAVQKHMSDTQGKALAGSTCIPNGTTTNALHSTVVEYLHSHSDDLRKPAVGPTFDALHAAYPCR